MKRISIFFDTNIIESRFTHEKQEFLFHGKITPDHCFYSIINCIKENNIEFLVDFYIPSIAWEEFKLHLIENYKEKVSLIAKHEESYRKAFGSTFDMIYEFKNGDEKKYIEYIELIMSDFLSEHHCEIINYPKDIAFFDTIISKCLNKQAPFQKAKVNGKDYNDAGFKDVLILETIIKHKKDNDCLCILISNDKDFSGVKDVLVFKTAEQLTKYLETNFYIQTTASIQYRIESDDYLKEILITSTGNKFDNSVIGFEVTSVTQEEDSVYNVDIKTEINEAIYLIKSKYESSSNDFIEITYKTENE